jgi:hypothetical protein
MGAVVAAGTRCVRCGEVIEAGELWDLDHADEGGGYAGAAHRYCNRAAPGLRGPGPEVEPEPEWPDGPADEYLPDPAGGFWSPLIDGKRWRVSREW